MNESLNNQPAELPISPEQRVMQAGLELAKTALQSAKGQDQRDQLVETLRESLKPSGLIVLDLEIQSSDERRSKHGYSRQQVIDLINLGRILPSKRISRARRANNR